MGTITPHTCGAGGLFHAALYPQDMSAQDMGQEAFGSMWQNLLEHGRKLAVLKG